jgi:hypothetical protein
VEVGSVAIDDREQEVGEVGLFLDLFLDDLGGCVRRRRGFHHRKVLGAERSHACDAVLGR